MILPPFLVIKTHIHIKIQTSRPLINSLFSMFIVQIDMLDLYSNMQSNDHKIKIIQSIIQNK